MEKIRHVLSLQELSLDTPWRTAKSYFASHPSLQDPNNAQAHLAWDDLDLLGLYEDYMKRLERDFFEKRGAVVASHKRLERKRREAFRELLMDLRQKGVITFGMKWKDVYPYIEKTDAYLEMVGQPGSTPLELFFDLIVELDEEYYKERRVVMDVVRVHFLLLTF
jgi:pre-mRNA-processing factor 40